MMTITFQTIGSFPDMVYFVPYPPGTVLCPIHTDFAQNNGRYGNCLSGTAAGGHTDWGSLPVLGKTNEADGLGTYGSNPGRTI